MSIAFDPFASNLPVADVLGELTEAMTERHAVLVAEPGAGKTTLVPGALLSAPWLTGRIILLEPRRVVARAAAARIASLFGEAPGDTVGTRMRMDVRVSGATRIEVVTEGVFARMALDDPELSGIGAVVFDEYHERSLDADFGLALALDVARSLRPDLRLLAMSATIDADAVASLMDGAAIIRSRGRTHPVALRYRSVPPRMPIERAVANTIRDGEGHTLAFLPGRAEVDRTVAALGDLPNAAVYPLHGGLDAEAQDRAVRPPDDQRRKVVVATPIAESSLTIEGIERVVDSGLVREPVFDVAAGITRLETRRASLASVEQRAGRAGRTGPGEAIRLWAEAATKSLPKHAPPEIVRSDLTQLLLDCLDWGTQPDALSWLDPPPAPALSAAHDTLASLDAITAAATITPFGRAIVRLPLSPRWAAAVLLTSEGGERERTARCAMLASERGLGGDAIDIAVRDRRWRSENGRRAKAARAMSVRWAHGASAEWGKLSCEGAIARSHRDRIARARGPARPDGRRAYLLASGRGAFLDADDPLAKEEWLVALDLTGQAREQRIVSAIAVTNAVLEEALADDVQEHETVSLRDGRIEAAREKRLGAIVLQRRKVPASAASSERVATAFAEAVRERGIERLPWDTAASALRGRLAWLRTRFGAAWPDTSDEALEQSFDEWLLPQLSGATQLDAITPPVLHDGLSTLVPWDRQKELERLAPARFVAPTGTRAVLDYPADGSAPRMSIRVQELFGLDRHPTVADEPLLLDLLSPARRQIQTTTDLPGFWRGSWADVRKDMRARYPRHPWPERPWEAEATTRAKRRGE